MMKRKLLFANPTFEDGEYNVTCRRDSAKYKSLTIGEAVEVCDLDNNVVGEGTINGLLFCRDVFDVPSFMLRIEHDPSCRTQRGLLDEMARVYGDFSPTEPVLAIRFVFRK